MNRIKTDATRENPDITRTQHQETREEQQEEKVTYTQHQEMPRTGNQRWKYRGNATHSDSGESRSGHTSEQIQNSPGPWKHSWKYRGNTTHSDSDESTERPRHKPDFIRVLSDTIIEQPSGHTSEQIQNSPGP